MNPMFVMNSLTFNLAGKLAVVLSLMMIAGCSFHSAQWEGAKALVALMTSEGSDPNNIYWWNMEFESETYRLFPVAWKDSIVLTDASRWMVVVRNSKVVTIRDLVISDQVTFDYRIKSNEGHYGARDEQASGYMSDNALPYEDPVMELLVVEGSIDNIETRIETTIPCRPERYVREELELDLNLFHRYARHGSERGSIR